MVQAKPGFEYPDALVRARAGCHLLAGLRKSHDAAQPAFGNNTGWLAPLVIGEAFMRSLSPTATMPKPRLRARMDTEHALRESYRLRCRVCGDRFIDDGFLLQCPRVEGFYPEGGVRNVARRDGLGTTMLDAVDTIGQLPDFYFQGVVSSTGAIAAHEPAKRLIGDGRFGGRQPRPILSQNLPFAPIFTAWTSNTRIIASSDRTDERKLISEMLAPALSNGNPPNSIVGGVLDMLEESNGRIVAVTNEEALRASRLFEDAEEIDVDPAAGVTFASLLNALKAREIPETATVLLHVTGLAGGASGIKQRPFVLHPRLWNSIRTAYWNTVLTEFGDSLVYRGLRKRNEPYAF